MSAVEKKPVSVILIAYNEAEVIADEVRPYSALGNRPLAPETTCLLPMAGGGY